MKEEEEEEKVKMSAKWITIHKTHFAMIGLLNYYGGRSFLIPVFCSDVNVVGNLMLNLILRLPLFEGSLGIGMPSPGTTSS